MDETLKDSADSIKENKWDELKDVQFNGHKESDFWTDKLETEVKQYRQQQEEFDKKSILAKIKAKITGKAPNETKHSANIKYAGEKRGKAYDRELFEAGMAEDELFPNRVEDVDQAYEMAKASDKYETKAAELRTQADEAFHNDDYEKYNKKMEDADYARWKASRIAAKSEKQYHDKQVVTEFKNNKNNSSSEINEYQEKRSA